MRLIKLLVLLLCLTASCDIDDDYHDLGCGFTYVGEGGDMNYIGGGDTQHNTEIFGNVTRLNSNNDYIIVEQVPSRTEYRSEFGSDLWADYYRYHDFLSDSTGWKQSWPVKEVFKIRRFAPTYYILRNKKVSFNNTKIDINKCELVADSLLDVDIRYKNVFSRKVNYWIIDKKNNIGYGPMDTLQFVNKCKILDINLLLERHNY